MWFNKKHLTEASNAANRKMQIDNNYFWHWKLAMQEFFFLLGMCIGSLIHAFFPWFLDFKLLEWRIARLKKLKEKLPNDPQLKKINFD